MYIDPNGCTCHFLENGQQCIACRQRDKDFEKHGKRCSCGTKLFASDELDRGQCTRCYYDE